jgi:hypothetical protein
MSEAFDELVLACRENGSEAPIRHVMTALGIAISPDEPDYSLVPDDIKTIVGATILFADSVEVSREAKGTFLKCAGRVVAGKPADSTAERMGDADIDGNLDLL